MSCNTDTSGPSGVTNSQALTSSRNSLSHLQRFYDAHPLPTISPDQKTVDMIKYYLKAREEHGFKLIESIRSNKDFGNPYILNKVVEHYNIDQFGTNFPKEVFDPEEVTAEEFEENIKRRRVDSNAAPRPPVAVPSVAPGSGMQGVPPQPPLAGHAGAAGAAAALAAAVASINSSMSGANVDRGVPSAREDTSKRKSKWG